MLLGQLSLSQYCNNQNKASFFGVISDMLSHWKVKAIGVNVITAFPSPGFSAKTWKPKINVDLYLIHCASAKFLMV